MQRQLQRLMEAVERPDITIQVIPGDAGSYPGLEGAFTILSFDGAPDFAYLEGAGGHGLLIRKADEVAALAVRFDLIRAAALSERESLKLIAAVMGRA